MQSLFDINSTKSFNSDSLREGSEFDYVTRTSQNQGILQQTSFINEQNINSEGNWSLGLLQMDFFYRHKPWYAGQFVRKVIPKIPLSSGSIHFLTSALNKLKPKLLSVLVRSVDKTFLNHKMNLPILENGKIDFIFIDRFVAELETERLQKLKHYLNENNLEDYKLTKIEEESISDFKNGKVEWAEFTFDSIFDCIKQGRRLKKEDQKSGNIPFVMAGISNTGVVNHISNPVAKFPKNSITVDIFGNTFYRNYDYGAGDDTGAYWNDSSEYTKEIMLFFATSMEKSILKKFDFGKKLRSSKSLDFKMTLPIKKGKLDFNKMETIITAIQKLVIKDVVMYVHNKDRQGK